MIFDMVIYVTFINLTEMECILLLLSSSSSSRIHSRADYFFLYVF